MADSERLSSLRGLYQDLCAYSENRLAQVERLWQELEATIQDFRELLEKPPKSDASRKAVQSGTINVDDVEYSINEEFKQGVLQLADAIDLDELQAAQLFLSVQEDAERPEGSATLVAVAQYHERRLFLLESLRIILAQSLNDDDEEKREAMREAVAIVLETKDETGRNGSLYTRKCIKSMGDIEKRILYLGEQLQRATVVGMTYSSDDLEIVQLQQSSLLSQHESLGAVLCYLFKGAHASSEDFRIFLNSVRLLDRLDAIVVHYVPALVAAIVQYGSAETGHIQDARSIHKKITGNIDTEPWSLHSFHAAAIIIWLAEYSGWYSENDVNPGPEGMDLAAEAESRAALFSKALADGALEFILAVCSTVTPQDWQDPARQELVALLLSDSHGIVLENGFYADYSRPLLMQQIESFAESCIANMPDAVRRLKAEEDELRLGLLTNRERLQLEALQGPPSAPLHLECFLVIIGFAYERRSDAAEEFWTDPDGNLFGFLHWASKRQTVPRVSAFCEMLCAVSEGEECAKSAHRFLLEEGQMPARKLRRSASMSWAQMFAELQLYASRVGARTPTGQQSGLQGRNIDASQMSEPESPLMLACYLRLIAHMCRESSVARDWLLNHPSFDIRNTLLLLNCALIPGHLRAAIFKTLEALMTGKMSNIGEDMWTRLDIGFSGGLLPGSQKPSHLSNPSAWSERMMFDTISKTFEESNAFVSFLRSIVCPSFDASTLNDSLPFPEGLGSTYRMPGIEPYIDVVLGKVFAKKIPELPEEVQIRMLRWTCLDFISICLGTFNENLVVIANQTPDGSIDNSIGTSSLKFYVQLHPFSRTMEWLFNEDVVKALFAASHYDVQDITKAVPSSVVVQGLLKSIEVMNLIFDLQATYLDIVRPLMKQQPPGRRTPVANSSLASFEDCVANNLRIVTDLSLYCGTGHQELTLAALNLLKRLSSSRKLNRISASMSRPTNRPNKVVEMLDREIDSNKVARSLAIELQPDPRELEHGPEAPGYMIKLNVLGFLNSTLRAIPEHPNIAHLFLGFSCDRSTLTVSPDGPFATNTSLFHTVLNMAQTYPLGLDGSIVSWMMRMKESSLQVLKSLWGYPLGSSITVAELRSNLFLATQFLDQPIISLETLWNGRSIAEADFLIEESAGALADFLSYRSMLFEYAVTELRFAAREGSASGQSRVLSTLMGSSSDLNGELVAHPNIFDFFDFVDLDITRENEMPELLYLRGLDLSACSTDNSPTAGPSYDIAAVEELVQLKRNELLSKQRIQPSSAEDQQITAEAIRLLGFIVTANSTQQIHARRLQAIRSWVELVMVVVEICNMDTKSKSALILQALQVILPRLEKATYDNIPEATEMARLVTMLLKNLESDTLSGSAGRTGDVINDRLFHLFRICVRGTHVPQVTPALRDLFYTICSQYLAQLTSDECDAPVIRQQSMQNVKSAGDRLVDVICDDSFAGDEDTKLSALLLLNLLTCLARQEDSDFIVDSFVRLNYLDMILDSVKNISQEVQVTDTKDVSLLLSYYNAQLSLLLQVSQSRHGSIQILNIGFFSAIRQSRLFAADPDIGVDVDNPKTLRQYYELLLSIIRIIISTALNRGNKNQQTVEQARQFLAENRQSMVGIFKRYANIGGVVSQRTRTDLEELVKAYVALITMAKFVDFETEKNLQKQSGRRGFT